MQDNRQLGLLLVILLLLLVLWNFDKVAASLGMSEGFCGTVDGKAVVWGPMLYENSAALGLQPDERFLNYIHVMPSMDPIVAPGAAPAATPAPGPAPSQMSQSIADTITGTPPAAQPAAPPTAEEVAKAEKKETFRRRERFGMGGSPCLVQLINIAILILLGVVIFYLVAPLVAKR